MQISRWVGRGAALAGAGVLLGAFGAHALKSHLPQDLLVIFETANRYQLTHALGLIAVGLVEQARADRLFTWAGRAMLLGVLIFSGSLYLLALTGQRWLGAITPIGGVALVVGWILLAVAALRRA